MAAHPSAVPPHTHFTLEQLVIMGFALLLYISERFRLLYLNLQLCFLALFLVCVRLAYEFRGGGFEGLAFTDVALFALLVPLLISLASFPLRTLSAESGQDPS